MKNMNTYALTSTPRKNFAAESKSQFSIILFTQKSLGFFFFSFFLFFSLSAVRVVKKHRRVLLGLRTTKCL